MPVFHDQLHRAISLSAVPEKIISVVPSQTELLFYLGLDAEIIGITKFCIHPANKFKTTTKVGGTKQLNTELIKSLKPDLIIANKEENDRGQIEELSKLFPVWISDINNLAQALDMIHNVGLLVDRQTEAEVLFKAITAGFKSFPLPQLNLRVAYLIWRKPYIVAATNTYIDSMLQLCGFTNAFEAERYPELGSDDLIRVKPDVVFLSSEPYPFKQKHIIEFQELLPQAKVLLVDGEMFSWYGSRLLQVPEYLEGLIAEL
ncbi:substrate-binding protein [Mucilaginibacter pineti]|uniref:Substrate-binding protein n=1 Tax=Mucilaginibacter pineti TaxID=1391627 RepID=A0A1G6U7R7_9SPHI|nr:helical backbone metal receptor [Mucilaginibacter pineti]SDD37254.1 substrate-binding protein [Mucilaginibacter pineti]